jgi:16S rRNA (guanine527-N7)-methyltransferase
VSSGEFRARLTVRAQAADLAVADATIDRIEIYYRLLNRWNRKINLTALSLESLSDSAIDRMLIEPLAAAHAVPSGPLIWWDLGSGAGSPALPMRLLRPMAALTLVEARSRKAAFLREVVRELQLSAVEVFDGRFEHLIGRADVAKVANLVTVRAVRIDDALFHASSHLLKGAGKLMLFSSRHARIPAAAQFSIERAIDLIPGGASMLLILRANT